MSRPDQGTSWERARDLAWAHLAQYHSDEWQALLTKHRHIEHLLGLGRHSPSEGDYCEDLVRSFLRDVLPKRYSIDKGFIRGIVMPRQEYVSPQLDVIIHDTAEYAPILRSGEFVVVLPDAVVGYLEVKKTLRRQE